MSKITEEIAKLAEPVVRDAGCELWDVEFVKEAGSRYLRVYIDKAEGVSINDCETVSRILDPMLDEVDLINESYTFEVSSAGLERALKRPSDFEKFMGSTINVRLYGSKFGSKEHTGKLSGYIDGAVEMTVGANTYRFEKSEVANVRLCIE